jgi:hypothetical protein
MFYRTHWVRRIEETWERKPLVWLTGARGTGKSTLLQGLPDCAYYDCDQAEALQWMEDPAEFFKGQTAPRVALDNLENLPDPGDVLQKGFAAAPDLRVVVAGSSGMNLSAAHQAILPEWRETILLTPLCSQDLADFKRSELKHRLQQGGLPGFFLAPALEAGDLDGWIEAFLEEDIGAFLRVKQYSLVKFLRMAWTRSGSAFEATAYAKHCEVSRPAIAKYLTVLETVHALLVLRPYTTRRPTEILAAPKVFCFDTGFTCHIKGWKYLRQDDLAQLWEQFVYNELLAHFNPRAIHYWRDKRNHAVDFVLAFRDAAPAAVQCMWVSDEFDPAGLKSFRIQYPQGQNFVVCHDVLMPYRKNFSGLKVTFLPLADLVTALKGLAAA